MIELSDFWKENYNIAIDQNGKLVSVPAKQGEKDHWELYSRLNKKLGNIMGKIGPWPGFGSLDNTIYHLPNKLAKLNYINIYPLSLTLIGYFVVIFPYKPTKKQLYTLKTLYEPLSNPKYKICYFEKPENQYLEYSDPILKEGIDNLWEFIKNTELLIEQGNQGRD